MNPGSGNEQFAAAMRQLSTRVNQIEGTVKAHLAPFLQRLDRLERHLGLVPQAPLPASPQPAGPAVPSAVVRAAAPIVPRGTPRVRPIVPSSAARAPAAPAAPIAYAPQTKEAVISEIVQGLASAIPSMLAGALASAFAPEEPAPAAAQGSSPPPPPPPATTGATGAGDETSWLHDELTAEGTTVPEVVTEVQSTSVSH